MLISWYYNYSQNYSHIIIFEMLYKGFNTEVCTVTYKCAFLCNRTWRRQPLASYIYNFPRLNLYILFSLSSLPSLLHAILLFCEHICNLASTQSQNCTASTIYGNLPKSEACIKFAPLSDRETRLSSPPPPPPPHAPASPGPGGTNVRRRRG